MGYYGGGRGPMEFCTAGDLRGYTLKEGDVVRFGHLRYTVGREYLSCYKECNRKIFDDLGLDAAAFCEAAYGYAPSGGDWPPYRVDDYGAVYRVVMALYAKLQTKPMDQVSDWVDRVRKEAADAASSG